MLTMRDDQMEAFAAQARKAFRERLANRLIDKYKLSDGRVARDAVRRAVNAADTYDIQEEEGITVLAELMIEEGTGFLDDRNKPQAREILSNRKLAEGARIQLLLQRRPWEPLCAAEPCVESA